MARRLISDFTVTAGDHVRFYSDSACTQRIDVFDAGTGGTDYSAWYTAPTGGVVTGLWVQDGVSAAWARVESPFSAPSSAIPLTVAPSTNPSSSIAATDVSAWQGNTFYPVGRLVVNPSGDIVRCTTAHGATGSYDASKFTASSNGSYPARAGGTSGTAAPLPFFNVRDYGAKGDGAQVSDAAITTGTSALSSTAATWSSADVTKAIRVAGAGAAGADLVTTISGFTDSHNVTLTGNAGTTVSGAVAAWGTDDSTAIAAANTAAGAVRGTVLFPVGVYMADNLAMTSGQVLWRAAARTMTRFGNQSRADGAVIIRHQPGSSNPLLNMNAGALTLEGVTLDGNNAPGTVLQISHGFETRLDTVRVCYGAGIGLDIQGSDNTSYRDVFVDNCGSNSLPAVRVTAAYPRTINTIDFTGLTIERCQGCHLDINTAVDSTNNDYAEFIRIHKLHVECPSDNGGTPNTVPLVQIGNCRAVTLSEPFIYGGPGPLISHQYNAALSGLGGVAVIGGQLLGRSSGSGSQPAYLVHLITGDQFAMIGTRVDSYSAQAVLVDSTYGANVYIDPTVMQVPGLPTVVTDNRATINPFYFNTPARFLGPTAGVPNSQSTARGIWLGQNSSGAPTISLATGTRNWQIVCDEANNRLDFNIAGTAVLGYFDSSGNLQIKSGLIRSLVSKSTGYTVANDSTVVSTAGAALTLPTAVSATGREFTLTNADASLSASIITTSSQTINGAAPWALNPGESITVQSDGANWRLVGEVLSAGSGLVKTGNQLTATSASLDGLSAPLVATYYYAPQAASLGTITLGAGALKGGFLVAGRTCTLTQIGLEITTAGSTGAVVRLGIYKFPAGSSSNTASLLVDAGTIDGTVTGYAELTISQAVSAGDKLLLVAACQGAPTTGPVVRSNSGSVLYAGSTTALTLSQNPLVGSGLTGITGALPGTHALTGSTSCARVLVKAAS